MSKLISTNKRIAKNTIFLYFRMFIVMTISLITVRVLLRTLGVEDYGTYNALAGFVFSLGFVSNTLSSASQRFFSYYIGQSNNELLHKSFLMIFFTYLFVVLLIIVVAETLGLWFVFNKMILPDGRDATIMCVYQMALLTTCFSLLASPFQALIISHEDMKTYASISIYEVVFKLVIILLLPIFPVDKLFLYSILHFTVYVGIACVYYLICVRKYKEAHLRWYWDKCMFKEIFSYSSWSLLGSISGVCSSQGVNILLNLFYGPVANAAYAISVQISSAVNQFSSSFYTAVRPSLIKSYANGDYIYMSKLFYMSNKVLFILMYILIVPIFLVTESLLSIWLGNVEQYMVEFVRLALIYTFILCLSNPITTIIQAANKVKLYHGIIDTFTLICLPIIYILFKNGISPIYGYITMIVVFIIAHYLRLSILKKTTLFSYREYVFNFVLPIIKTVILLIIVFYGINLLEIDSDLIAVFIKGSLGFILSLLIGFICVLSKVDRALLREFVKSMFVKLRLK